MPESPEQRDSGVVSSAGEPGPLSRLLQELVDASGDDAVDAWERELRPGDRVGRFEIRREVGRGGFGAVYEAFDTELNRVVAVKTLRLSRPRRDLSSDWIKKEAEAVARLDHPCIVTLHDVGTCDSGPYLVMELLRGKTLAQRIAEGPIPQAEALRIAEEMAKGLAHAHQRGVLHRDLKPANVFLCEDGRVKLLDFGLAHLLGTEGVSGAGTPKYMAPEQARGEEVDQRADVYAAGRVLGDMLGERRPRAVERAIAKATSTDPTTRPRDGQAWLEALETARASMAKPRRIGRYAALASILVGAVIVGVVVDRRAGHPGLSAGAEVGGRPTVAVADFTNETGEKELDSLSGLLITSLEQSTQLRVLTRSRMFDVLKQLGQETVERIDEPLAREVGRRTGARALLLASVRRLGDTYVVDMRALDPAQDEYLFTVHERASSKAAIFDLVDRLGETSRRKLAPGRGAEPPGTRGVASITTGNPKAWDLFFRGRQALDKMRFQEARPLLEEAIKTDPDFALPYYQIAVLDTWEILPQGSADSVERSFAEAEKRAQGLPEKEQLLLRAFKAERSGRGDEALRLFDQVASAYPLDKEAVFYAGDVRFHSKDRFSAVPYFERALQLDPGYTLVKGHMAGLMATMGPTTTQLEWIRREAGQESEPETVRDFARALLTGGHEAEAFALFDRLRASGDGPALEPGLAMYLSCTGKADEAEIMLRSELERLGGDRRARDALQVRLKTALAWTLVSVGKLDEATAEFDGIKFEPPKTALTHLMFAAAGRSGDSVEAAIRDLDQLKGTVEPAVGVAAAITLAAGGYPEAAGRMAGTVRESVGWDAFDAGARRYAEALESLGAAVPSAAEAQFREGMKHPEYDSRWLNELMLGLLYQRQGNCRAAVDALERARSSMCRGWSVHRFWSYPGVLHSLATCYERMGDVPKARERNDELLRRWARADPGLPLLAEAKALRARLAVAAK